MNFHNDEQDDGFASEESKTQRKKRMTELQDIGEQLLTLNARQLAQIELPERLYAALQEYQRLPNRHGAQRRQRQFIGKLMRGSDHDSIRQSLERVLAPSPEQTRRSQQIERWGQRLLNGSEEDIQAFLEDHPTAERQQLRSLVRRYQAAQVAPDDQGGQIATPDSDDTAPAQSAESAVSGEMVAARRRLLDYIKTS